MYNVIFLLRMSITQVITGNLQNVTICIVLTVEFYPLVRGNSHAEDCSRSTSLKYRKVASSNVVVKNEQKLVFPAQ